MSRPIDITLLTCTYNRCSDLEAMLETAFAQETDREFCYEVVVVDNNSTDHTRAVVEKFIARGGVDINYIFEGRQGKSNALNTGLSAVRGHIYTIADDDFLLPERWLSGIFAAFEKHPDVSFVSGKVLPAWQTQPPAWLTKDHWSAIAMADYGDEPFIVNDENQICLLACSFKTRDVLEVGGYRDGLGVTSGQVGGTEDLELLQRLWNSGRKGIYVPELWFHHKVTPNRCTKEYHRYWHTGHGAFYAAMRDPDFERSKFKLLGVPSHLYSQAIRDFSELVKRGLTGKWDEAFQLETRLRFFLGFFRERARNRH